jgi:PAS domain S-box-containing protein
MSRWRRGCKDHGSNESGLSGDESSEDERQPGRGDGKPAERDRRLEDDVRDLAEGFVATDTSGRFRSVRTLAPLAQALDHIDFSVLILDLNFHIVYANASATRTSGFALNDLIGTHPRIFGSGWHSNDFYDESERTVQSGLPWHGVFTNRRKSGEIYQEETSISPIFDADDSIIAYVETKRELTGSRRLQGELMQARTEQEAIAQIMREVVPTKDLRETAQSFCDAVVRLADIDAAVVLHTLGGTKMRTIAVSGTTVYDPTNIEPYDARITSSVLEQVASGPVRMLLTPGEWPGYEELREAIVKDGLTWVVATPIKLGDKMIGTLNLASRDPSTEMSVESRFPFFEQLGWYAGSLFGFQSTEFERDADLYAVVKDIIDAGRFRIVFQPIVDLVTHQAVGYEALTRFDDGVSPAERFADAHIVGLGIELECATAAAALRAAEPLPEGTFLNLNFSAAAILGGSAAEVVRGSRRCIVIEITEHELLHDFAAVRHAISQIENCELAIDDFGAGFTTLVEIVELLPRFLKLDISMIHEVDKRPIFQSMVEAICHFAAQTGTVIIAEGVETPAEAEILRSLGSSLDSGCLLAQGYLFGVPEGVHDTQSEPDEGDNATNG